MGQGLELTLHGLFGKKKPKDRSTVELGYSGPAYNGNLSRADKFLDHRGFLVAITDSLFIAS